MKAKKSLQLLGLAIIVGIAAYNVRLATNNTGSSDVSLKDVEALAACECSCPSAYDVKCAKQELIVQYSNTQTGWSISATGTLSNSSSTAVAFDNKGDRLWVISWTGCTSTPDVDNCCDHTKISTAPTIQDAKEASKNNKDASKDNKDSKDNK
jgi:hypothetical protein